MPWYIKEYNFDVASRLYQRPLHWFFLDFSKENKYGGGLNKVVNFRQIVLTVIDIVKMCFVNSTCRKATIICLKPLHIFVNDAYC